MGKADLKLVGARQWHLSTDTEPVIDRSKGFIVLYHHQILILKRREIYIHTYTGCNKNNQSMQRKKREIKNTEVKLVVHLLKPKV